MIDFFKVIICTLGLSACAPPAKPASPTTPHVDFAFKAFVEMYKTDKMRFLGTEDTRPITIQFQSLNQGGYEGLCYYYPTRLIQIDPVSWLFGSWDDKIVLFYHEMGHCDLDLHGHTKDESIMNPYGIPGAQFATDREGYLRKLFLEGK